MNGQRYRSLTGSVSNVTWQWSKGGIPIANPIADTYTPVTGDVGDRLTAKASYTVGHAASKTAVGMTAEMVTIDTRNSAPMFLDQGDETDGLQTETATREVEENTTAIATDDTSDTDNPNANVGSVVTTEDTRTLDADPVIYDD